MSNGSHDMSHVTGHRPGHTGHMLQAWSHRSQATGHRPGHTVTGLITKATGHKPGHTGHRLGHTGHRSQVESHLNCTVT